MQTGRPASGATPRRGSVPRLRIRDRSPTAPSAKSESSTRSATQLSNEELDRRRRKLDSSSASGSVYLPLFQSPDIENGIGIYTDPSGSEDPLCRHHHDRQTEDSPRSVANTSHRRCLYIALYRVQIKRTDGRMDGWMRLMQQTRLSKAFDRHSSDVGARSAPSANRQRLWRLSAVSR